MEKELILGKAPAAGADSITQCNFFKTLMTNRVGRIDGAYLCSWSDNGDRGMRVIYETDVPGAYTYAKKVEELAELVWKEVIHNKKPECRIILRRTVIDKEEVKNDTALNGTGRGNGRHR